LEEILNKEDIAKLVDVIAGGNMEKFGRALDVSGAAVKHWISGTSKPQKKKMKTLLEMRRHTKECPENPELALTEPFKQDRVKEGVGDYPLGQSTPYTPSQLKHQARSIADEVYNTLSPDRREQVDKLFVAEVMKARVEQDYEEVKHVEGKEAEP